MRAISRIEAAWSKFDLLLEAEARGVVGVDRAKILDQQVINDQAYFILCWGQLEAEIDDRCREAIIQRRNHQDWQIRRAWDLYNPGDPRFSGLSFENRARLVLDGQAGRGALSL